MKVLWPWIFILGCSFIVCTYIGALVRKKKIAELIPLARTFRLSDLPGYQRIRRLIFITNIIALIVMTVFLSGVFFLASRPLRTVHTETINPLLTKNEVMICNQAPLESMASSVLYGYFTQLAHNPNNVLGVTTKTLRTVPLTNQNWYVAKKLEDYSRVYEKVHGLGADAHIDDAPDDVLLLKAEYEKSILYTNYTTNFLDNMALCIAGFPELAYEKTRVDRSLLFCGDNRLPTRYRPRYTFTSVRQFAQRYRVKINILDGCVSPPGNNTARFKRLAQSTGGKYFATNAYVGNSKAIDQEKKSLKNFYATIMYPLDSQDYPKEHIPFTFQVENPGIFIVTLTMVAVLFSLVMMWVKP